MELNIQRFAQGEVDIEVVLNTDSFDNQIAYLEDKAEALAEEIKALSKVEPVDSEIMLKARQDYEKLGQQIDRLKNKQKQMNNVGGFNFSKDLKDANKRLTSIIKKVGRWALALIGIRSIYALLSNAASQLDKTNQKTKANLDYIKSSLATAFEPIITKIVDWAMRLLDTINILVYKLTGKNLFKDAAKNFKSANKSAKEMSKTLAGFDEMNVVSKSSVGASGGGGVSPNEWTKPEDAPVPKWMQWIIDNKGALIGGITGIAGALIGLKLGLDPVMAVGLALVGLGIGMLIDDILTALQDPTWENWGKVIADIGVIVGGVMLLLGNWWGLLVAGIALLVKLVIDNWESIKSVLITVGTWIYENALKPTWEVIKAVLDTIWFLIKAFFSPLKAILVSVYYLVVDPIKTAFDAIKKIIKDIFGTFKNLITGIGKLFNGDLKGALNDFKTAFKKIFDALWTIAKTPINLLIDGINALIKGINKISFDIPDWVPVIGGDKWGFNIPTIPKLAKGGIINNPGHGIAIGGEKGREGVIPLTDSQQMELLGEAIGRYITINLTNNTNLDGRIIDRRITKVHSNNNFLTNK